MNDQGIDNEITGTKQKAETTPMYQLAQLGHTIAVKFCQKSLSDLTDQKFVCCQGYKFNTNWQQGSHSYCGIQADISAHALMITRAENGKCHFWSHLKSDMAIPLSAWKENQNI